MVFPLTMRFKTKYEYGKCHKVSYFFSTHIKIISKPTNKFYLGGEQKKQTKLATLAGHQMRVLYLAQSPDGENIVTGAGDETLRFWKVFPARNSK